MASILRLKSFGGGTDFVNLENVHIHHEDDGPRGECFVVTSAIAKTSWHVFSGTAEYDKLNSWLVSNRVFGDSLIR